MSIFGKRRHVQPRTTSDLLSQFTDLDGKPFEYEYVHLA